jgi:hypothetical protein
MYAKSHKQGLMQLRLAWSCAIIRASFAIANRPRPHRLEA